MTIELSRTVQRRSPDWFVPHSAVILLQRALRLASAVAKPDAAANITAAENYVRGIWLSNL